MDVIVIIILRKRMEGLLEESSFAGLACISAIVSVGGFISSFIEIDDVNEGDVDGINVGEIEGINEGENEGVLDGAA